MALHYKYAVFRQLRHACMLACRGAFCKDHVTTDYIVMWLVAFMRTHVHLIMSVYLTDR